MNDLLKYQVKTMLEKAYRYLGIRDPRHLRVWVYTAIEYMIKDREHYIEAGDMDTPEYCITTKHGVICKLIPLARQTIRDQEKDHIREHTAVLSLMVRNKEVRYVCAYSHATLYSDPKQNSYSVPVYRYTELEEIPPKMVKYMPHIIRPIATAWGREIYGMMFMAFANIRKNQILKDIPRKTELAMLAIPYTQPEEIQINGDRITGKLVLLGQQNSLWEQMREDHKYSYSRKLCLLITENQLCYVIKTHHIYSYFRKVIYDDVPGGCSYEPTEEKVEITYEYVTLENIPQDIYPAYR